MAFRMMFFQHEFGDDDANDPYCGSGIEGIGIGAKNISDLSGNQGALVLG